MDYPWWQAQLVQGVVTALVVAPLLYGVSYLEQVISEWRYARYQRHQHRRYGK